MRVFGPLFTPAARPAWLSGFGLFFLLGTWFFAARDHRFRTQPIAFNHAKHVANGLSCTDCHSGAESQAHATLPALSACLACHESAVTQSAEEAKIRALAAAGKDLDWTQVTRVPAHVYFSHQRHVKLAGMACAACHGPMEKATAPPRRPFRALTMDACIRCHEQNRVKTDCNDCHR